MTNIKRYKAILKIIVLSYIVLGVLCGFLNYVVAEGSTEEVKKFVNSFWHIYENYIKSAFMIIGSYITIVILKASNKSNKISLFRRVSLYSFCIVAMIIHIIIPVFSGIYDFYFIAMPLPWVTTGLQLLAAYDGNLMSYIYNTWMMDFVITGFVLVQIISYGGIIFLGRRWYCSMICSYNGFASEIFGEGLPIINSEKKKKGIQSESIKMILLVSKVLMFLVSLFFTLYWILYLINGTELIPKELASTLEVNKYLFFELILMMLFWVVLGGRVYCYYCPSGTVFGLLGRVFGQKIKTNLTNCIGCSKCNNTCPMSIDIESKASKGNNLQSIMCVGCGHCVDKCPTGTLKYSTSFLELLR